MALFDDLTVLLKYRNDPRNAAEVAKARGQVEGTRRGFSSLTKSALGVTAGIGGVALGLGVAGRAMLSFGRESVDVFKQIQTGMSTIEGLVGISSEQLQAWVPDMQAIRRETGRTMGELTEGLYDVTSAGLRGDVAMETLRISALGSAAGMGETRVIADLLTSAINAWGPAALTAAQAGDDLAKAVELGKLPADALAGSMGQLIPIASAMGLEFGEMAGLMAAMSRTGTTAETASVQLGQVLSLLLKPGKEARDTLEEFGFSAEQLRARVADEGLLTVLQDLKDAFGEDEEAIARVFPNIRALRGVFDLLGPNLAANVAIVDDMTNSQGKLGEAFSEVTDDVAFAENQFQAATENMKAQIGALIAPSTVSGLNAVAGAFDRIAEAAERAVQRRERFQEFLSIQERLAQGDRTGAMGMFEDLDVREQQDLLREINERSVETGQAPMQVLLNMAAAETLERMRAGDITQGQALAELDRLAEETGGMRSLANVLTAAAAISPESPAQLLEMGEAAQQFSPEEMADIISQGLPVGGTPLARRLAAESFAEGIESEEGRAGFERRFAPPAGPEAPTLDANLAALAAGEGGTLPATQVQGLIDAETFSTMFPSGIGEGGIEASDLESRMAARGQPAGFDAVEQTRAAVRTQLVEVATEDPAAALAQLLRARSEFGLPNQAFNDLFGAISGYLDTESINTAIASIPSALERQATFDYFGIQAPAAEPAEAAEPAPGAPPAEAAAPAPAATPAEAAEPALAAPETATEGAESAPEVAAGATTPPEAAEAAEAPPGPEIGEDLGPATAPLAEEPPEEERRGLVGRIIRAASDLGERLILGPQEASAAPETPAEFAEGARAFKFAPGTDETTFAAAEAAPPADTGEMAMETPALQPLVVAVEGPMAPVPVNGDTTNVNEGATTTSNNTTINADIKIYGAQDPQATAVAVREELAKETQAAVRNADPGVVR